MAQESKWKGKPWSERSKMPEYCCDSTELTFGKRKGEKLGDVPASYLLWCARDEDVSANNPGLVAYVERGRKHLEREAKLEQEQRRNDRR